MTDSNDIINMVFDNLIKVMIKHNYETLNIDQLLELRRAFIINPLDDVLEVD